MQTEISVPDGPDDSTLIEAMAAGDEGALASLWARHGGAVTGLATKFLGNAADGEEIAQVTFQRAWAAAGRFNKDKGAGKTWLFAIARNAARDALRRRRIRWVVGLDDLDSEVSDDVPSAETRVADSQALRDVRTALLELPDAQRMALLLATVGDLETPEVATILGRSRGAVEQLIVRARKALRARMEEMGHAR